MSKFLIAGLFLASMFIDGIIFPALFGFREGFLTVLFIIVLLLYREVNFPNAVLVIVFAVIAEFYWGLRLGILILPLLVSVGAFLLLNTFFNIRSKVFMIISGTIMFIVFWWSSALITKIL